MKNRGNTLLPKKRAARRSLSILLVLGLTSVLSVFTALPASAALITDAIDLSEATPGATGTLSNGVTWINVGGAGGSDGDTFGFTFDQPVAVRFSIISLNGAGECVVLPLGTITESLAPGAVRTGDEVCGPAENLALSIFTHPSLTELLVTGTGNTGLSRGFTFVEVTADAEPFPTFACPGNGFLFQTQTGGATDSIEVDLVSGASNVAAANFIDSLNATGYNPLDNYIYGWTNEGGGGIVRIGSDYATDLLGLPSNWATVPDSLEANGAIIGEFDAQGHYWLALPTGGGTIQWAEIDLAPGSPTYMEVLSSGTAAPAAPGLAAPFDWAYNLDNGDLYAVVESGNTNPPSFALVRFDTDTGTMSLVRQLGPLQHANGTFATGFGGAFSDPDGNLYVSDNASGGIWRVNMLTGSAVFLSAGPAAGGNDGARCFLASLAQCVPALTPTGPIPAGYNRIVGTAGDDSITGTAGPDVIFGLGGNDAISAVGGNDIVYGGAGDDRVTGGDGNDLISGGDGNDSLTGIGGDDCLAGDAGNDSLTGGSGNDEMHGGIGDDALTGVGGDDFMTGGPGNDRMTGGDQNDYLNAGAGTDECTGGDGIDTGLSCETRTTLEN